MRCSDRLRKVLGIRDGGLRFHRRGGWGYAAVILRCRVVDADALEIPRESRELTGTSDSWVQLRGLPQ